jgi:hypothetical protein
MFLVYMKKNILVHAASNAMALIIAFPAYGRRAVLSSRPVQ